MAHTEHIFDIQGVEHKAYYRGSVTLGEVETCNNGEQLDGYDGLRYSYIEVIDDGVLESTEGKGFSFDDKVAKIPVSTQNITYTANRSRELGSEVLNFPKLVGQDVVNFYNMQLPAGVTMGQAIAMKNLNYICNKSYGNENDNYTLHCIDESTLIGMQPVVFTVVQTVFNETGGTIEITCTDSTGAVEYSLDNVTFQDSNIFENQIAGEITVYVKDTLRTNSRTFTVQVEMA